MAAEAPTTFLAELEKFQLLTPAQVHEAGALGETQPDTRKLAAELVRRGWLTPFQANQLLLGRGQSLVLGPYVLLERLGQGGMGQVYKARHALMDRTVALKVVRADRLDRPETLGRFRREMQAAAKLAHPNIVVAHDAAQVGDVHFLVTEYVEGTDLSRLLKQRGRLPLAQACAYVRQTALGLQHAHERGLVHRDIKPSNLILAADGAVKILDFGLARLRTQLDAAATASDLTREGSVMGTPDYISPEQARESHTADIRADIYSLGCTLYHFLAGQPPFPGGSLTEKLLKHQQAEPAPIERLCTELPAGLATVVRTMMAKRAEDRYQTPQQVVDALAPFAAAQLEEVRLERQVAAVSDSATASWSTSPTQVGRPRQPGHWPPWSRNRAVQLGALGVVVLIVIAFSLFQRTAETPPKKGAEPLVAVGDKPPFDKNFNDKKPDGNKPEQKKTDDQKTPPDKKPAGFPIPGELPRLPPLLDGPPRPIKGLKAHTGTVLALAFSADGARLASGSDDTQVRLWDGVTGDLLGKPLVHDDPVRALAWSPGGKRLAAGVWGRGYDASIRIWDLPELKPQILKWADKTGTPSLADVRSIAFSPDGKRLASGGGPLRLWNLDKGGEPIMLNWQKTIPSYLYGVTFAPDGKTVAAGSHEMGDNIRIWETDAPAEPVLLRGNEKAFGLSHSDVHGALSYSAGGKLFVRVTSMGRGPAAQAGSVMTWDVDATKNLITLRDKFKVPGGAVFALLTSADGHMRIAVAAGPSDIGGRDLPPGDITLWDSATTQVRAFDPGHNSSITALAFSPDGTRLASGSADHSVKLWDLSR